MNNKRVQNIKHAQKAAQLTREISSLFHQITVDNPGLMGIYVNRIKLSDDKSICTVYFGAFGGKEEFDKKLGELILYKPSMRTALAQKIYGRYTPDLVFRYDEQIEKQQKIDSLLDKLKDDGQL